MFILRHDSAKRVLDVMTTTTIFFECKDWAQRPASTRIDSLGIIDPRIRATAFVAACNRIRQRGDIAKLN
jgi:hypothetical protein